MRFFAGTTRVAIAAIAALVAVALGCAAPSRDTKVATTTMAAPAPAGSPTPASVATFRATVLVGRHALQRSFVGPGGRVYAATMDELYAYDPASSATGERFRFRGKLAATPSGSRLYRTEGKELFELDASGVDQRKVTFRTAVESLTFSPSGALLGVFTHDRDALVTLRVLRATDLQEVARLPGVHWTTSELVWSPDELHAVVGPRVVETRTMKVLYERHALDRAPMLLEDGRLSWLFEDLLETFDLAKGTSTLAWLPCKGQSQAEPAQHRFVTRCQAETILTTVTGSTPAFTRAPAEAPPDPEDSREPTGAPSTRVPPDPRFSRNVLDGGRALLEGLTMRLDDGELIVPSKEEPTKVAGRVRLAPARSGAASRSFEVRENHILVKGPGGAALADIDFKPFAPEPKSVTLVGDQVVVTRPGWNPTEPPTEAHVCSFAGTCQPRFERSDTLLGVFGDELVASQDKAGDTTLVRENLRTGARTETALPVPLTALARSSDGSFFIAVALKKTGEGATFMRIDAQSGKLTAILELDDPSYSSARLLGVLGERIVLAPFFGNYAHIVLLDARSFTQKEHYLLGPGSMLHVREDGSFETTGDAKLLENVVVCTDGKRFSPIEACARAAAPR